MVQSAKKRKSTKFIWVFVALGIYNFEKRPLYATIRMQLSGKKRAMVHWAFLTRDIVFFATAWPT